MAQPAAPDPPPPHGGRVGAGIPQHLAELTDTAGVAHLVADDAMTAGHSTGRYHAVCGCQVLAASLTTPESGYCQSCARGAADR